MKYSAGAAVVLVALFGAVVVRTAWLSDDAYITFRTADNFVHGHGLTWNPGERVQAYTHPLWMFLVTGVCAVTREMFASAVVLSILVSLAAVLVLGLRVSASPRGAALALLLAVSSKAFVDYSTSGLENALTHLLLAVFAAVFFRGGFSTRKVFLLSLVAGLAALNRMDTILLLLPALLFALYKARSWKGARSMALGFLPFIVWEIFAVFYYGFPFPNPAYSKLGAGIPAAELARQGGFYLLNSIRIDPLTLAVAAAGMAVVFLRKYRPGLPLAAGCLLYLLYVVRVGGDFMSGRFLTAPFFIAVALLSRIRFKNAAVFGAVFLVAAAAGALPRYAPAKSGPHYANIAIDAHGISDERGFYFPYAGLLAAGREGPPPTLNREAGLKARKEGGVVINHALGYFGFFAGPGVHIVDPHGLADPLLAHMPAFYDPKWRIGHFARVIPGGYVETLRERKILIHDKNLGEYFRRINLIVRGKLFSLRRLKTIVEFNLGRYRHFLDWELYRFPPGTR